MLNLLLDGGVVGGGGAGFPLWKKLAAPAETLLINGAECEPLLCSDQYLMLRETDALVKGAEQLAGIVGASACVICVKERYTRQRAALEEAISRLSPGIRVHTLPAVYPAGDEQVIVHSATGGVVPPLGLPGQVGCVVCSVSTTVNAYYALKGRPVTHRLVTVAGEVRKPGVYRVPVGMAVSRLLEAAGEKTAPDGRLMLGGPMMGELAPEGGDPAITKTCGGVLVFPADHPLIRRETLPMEHMRNRAKSACIQCRACTDLCPRYLLGHPLYPHLSMRAFAMGREFEKSAALCMECGICELYACPMDLSPRRIQRHFKERLGAEGRREAFAPGRVNGMRAYRQVPAERLAARACVRSYAFDTPERALEAEASLVRIPLKQHIGTPARSVVEPGDRVSAGQVIGRMAPGELGANVHASIDGTVILVDQDAISIQTA